MLIEVNKIQPNTWNVNSMTELKFNALVESIKEENWNRLFPIEVQPEKDWKYTIIDWEHRYKALVEAWIENAHIEISDLEGGYEKLRTISKNSIHWTHDQVDEANLIAEIKTKGISDSEIMTAIWIDEKELIAIDNLTNFDISDFETEDDIDLTDAKIEEEIPTKQVTLDLQEGHFEVLEKLKNSLELDNVQDAILIAASYFQLNKENIDDWVLKIVKDWLFWTTEQIVDF